MRRRSARQVRDDKGFTLIELMVVVLIMGILMAIAVPTFLSTRGAAYDTSAKSNAANAYISEKAYYQDNQVFIDLSASGGSTFDSTLPWANASIPGAGKVTADAYTESGGTWTSNLGAGNTSNALLIMAEGEAPGDCFYIADAEETTTATPTVIEGYSETKGACAAPKAFPTAAQVTANQSSNAGAAISTSTADGVAATDWYPAW